MTRSAEANSLVQLLRDVCKSSDSRQQAMDRIILEIEPVYPGILEFIEDFRPFRDLKEK